MREMTFVDAVREGLAEEMAADPTIFVVGEGAGVRGGQLPDDCDGRLVNARGTVKQTRNMCLLSGCSRCRVYSSAIDFIVFHRRLCRALCIFSSL